MTVRGCASAERSWQSGVFSQRQILARAREYLERWILAT